MIAIGSIVECFRLMYANAWYLSGCDLIVCNESNTLEGLLNH